MTKIVNISIENYRPFKGKKILDFSTKEKNNFNIVFAGTGAGKTTFLDAISWCLYGKEPHKKLPRESLLNKIISKKLKTGETADVIVEIFLGDNNENLDYHIQRRLSFIKNSDGKTSILPQSEKFSAKLKDTRNNFIDATDPSIVANWIFPERIQHLFMFDGEQLEKFFETDSAKKTETAIKDITQIDKLDGAISHLKIISKDFLSKEDQNNPEIQKNEEYIRGCENKLQTLTNTRNTLIIQRDEATRSHSELEEELRTLDKGNYNSLRKQRDENQSSIKSIERKIEEHKKTRFDHLLKEIPILFCKNQIIDAFEKIERKYESGEIPADVKADFVEKLLSKKKCICHTPLLEGSSSRKYVEAFRDAVPLSKYEDEIRHGQQDLKTMLNSISNFLNQRKESFQHLCLLEEQSNEKKEYLRKILKEIENINEEHYNSVKAKKDFQFKEIGRYNTEIGRNDEEIVTYEAYKRTYEKDKSRLEKALLKTKEMREKYSICETAIDFLIDSQNNLINELKNDIEKRTNDIFLKSVLEPRVKKIKISDSFDIQALDEDDNNIYPELSSGQKQGLATSFMIALRRDSGFDSPILFDYPFGRIDKKLRSQFVDSLIKILGDVQLILFLIDGVEYTDEIKNKMSKHLGAIYELKKSEDEFMSEVILHD